MPIILESKPIIEEKLLSLENYCTKISSKNSPPVLKIILIGNNPASLVYIKNKRQLCELVGIGFELAKFEENVEADIIKNEILKANQDPKTTGLFVQFPVPSHIKEINIPQLIAPIKDVDGFHFSTIGNIYNGSIDGLIPCTPKGIITLCKHYKVELESKNIVILGRSSIVGKPLALLLANYDATVTICHSKTKNLKSYTQSADIIVSAVGKANMLNKEHLSSSKKQTIIDVGINSLNGKIVGDVDFDGVKEQVHAITPVPGGVGPLTVLSLVENILYAYCLQHNIKWELL